MKITNAKLPMFRWGEDWGKNLNFALTQIIYSFSYTLDRLSDGFLLSVTSITATYSANLSDSIILANGTFTVTLPSPSLAKNKRFTVKNTGAGTITVVGITGNIDGGASTTIATTASKEFVSDGTNFWII